ncbi:twin-arginine translocase TatA/TatE family subunit [Solilutibacter silvestris]|uniref:Sec-independent protein translocase protein TatA n=1 Tax=Solilutibacter silvestris TaxID=1645665 RepID=A0A2K1Q0U2_9GAMM|nr:twin-arginine translocase TatA/TatE family subunit [Lysobacter silvestris]PNS08644.1 tatAE: twin arginine-targeting protein translocase, TatA/E family [Lysobacter silvestris]
MSTWHWIIVLIVVLLVFGTKRLTSGARDVGKAINEFKKGMHTDDDEKKPQQSLSDDSQRNDGAAAQPSKQDDQAPR